MMRTAQPLALVPRRAWDRSVWNQLTSIDLRLIDELAFLSRLTSKSSRSGATYCFPGREWLAARLGCSVETITRHTKKLRDLGLLHKLQRRQVAGSWQTCLYRLVHPMAWAAAALRSKIAATARRLSELPHIASPSERRVTVQSSKESLRDVLARGLAKFAPR